MSSLRSALAAAVELEPIRVLIVDAQPVLRAGLAATLDAERDIGIAGVAGGAEQAVALASELRPDVAIIDLDLPGAGGLEATRRIHDSHECAGVNVLVLAPHDSDEALFAALRAGANGFVLKTLEPMELVHAVRVVAGGDGLLSASATRRLITALRSQPRPQAIRAELLEELTAREREVMGLVATGMRNHQIAERLVISPATVKTHVSRAMRKLDARDRSQLVAIAYQLGLVRTDDRRALWGVRAPATLLA